MNKNNLDSVWMNTDIGKWIRLRAEGRTKEANDFFLEIEGIAPMNFHNNVKKICEAIANQLKSESEFDEYLRELDKDDYDLVDFIISSGVFDDVSIFLAQKS